MQFISLREGGGDWELTRVLIGTIHISRHSIAMDCAASLSCTTQKTHTGQYHLACHCVLFTNTIHVRSLYDVDDGKIAFQSQATILIIRAENTVITLADWYHTPAPSAGRAPCVLSIVFGSVDSHFRGFIQSFRGYIDQWLRTLPRRT